MAADQLATWVCEEARRRCGCAGCVDRDGRLVRCRRLAAESALLAGHARGFRAGVEAAAAVAGRAPCSASPDDLVDLEAAIRALLPPPTGKEDERG